ncbi:tetratricopeptide repeat protein [Micromonospora sp. DT227]|uniref:tetratricopeptide repeat protein n=1 Tax=Micromonospora sp. DT227 TaxID=3393433 RepID=UPI003CF8D74E
MTRVFRRRLRRRVVGLAVVAAGCALVAVSAWWLPADWWSPRPGWTGTEQAGWIAGIAGAVFALASLVFDRLDARGARAAGSARVGGVVRIGRVPQQAAWFQDREARVDLMRAARTGRTAVLTQVLSGMGGVGKTQLAAQFARHLDTNGELDVLVWVTASSRDAIIAAYAEAARAVGVATADLEPETAAGRLLVWLERANRRWLVVLDNLDAPGDAAGWWPPANRDGRTVVTTRRRDPVLHTDGRVLVPVDLFTPAEAVDYLTRATGTSGDQQGDVEALAADLGYLPLAVAQAAAFIRDRGIDAAAYRDRLAGQRLADLAPPDDALPDDHRATVAATWLLSLDAADNHPPRGLARPVLDLAALLDPNGIPEAVFTTDAVVAHLGAVTGQDVAAPMVTDAMRNLHRLNLVTQDAATAGVRVHALVQRATRDHGDTARLGAAARAAADGLLALWPDIDRDPKYTQILRANTATLRAGSGDSLLLPDPHGLLFRSIRSLGDTGQVSAAATALEQLLTDCLRVLGPDHGDTLTTRHNLAYWRGEAGDPTGAVAAFEQLLTDCLRVRGPDHPHTLDIRHNLAYWRGEAGDPTGAVAAYEQLLTDQLRVRGPDHPHTLATRGHLTRWRVEAGDTTGVVAAFEQLLTDYLRVLGPDHPDTLATRGNLSYWRGKSGDIAGAVAAFEQLLTDQLRVLGPDHPDTLITRHDLAGRRGEAGDAPGAVTAYRQLLSDQLRVLGPDHPATLITRHNLARWRGEAGDPAGAVTAYRQLLTDRLRVLGPDHPHTLTTRHNLAHWRGEAGDPTGAIAAYEQLLTDRLRVLGPDHPDTMNTRHNLAGWRKRAGDPTTDASQDDGR